MLSWEKIDNEKLFQRLVNHLFGLECNSPGFIPSSPYIGADGAWDGYYNGHYPLENSSGVWSIQSKWTKKSFKEAYSWLKGEIRKELKNAKRNNVTHLRIATNAELKVDQRRDLESLNAGQVSTLKVWHRESLTLRIEQQPFIRSYFFDLPQHPKFVPSELYFQQVEKDLLSAPMIEKFKEYIAQVNRLLRSDRSILLIHSPGGYGKSHLLRDAVPETHKTDPNRQAWMTRQAHRSVEDAIQNEIIKGKNYLLIFDDADRFPDEVKSLIAFARHEGNTVKLILTLRTSGLRLIHEILRQLRCEGIYEEMAISEWRREDLVQLLRTAAGQERVEDEETLATIYPNPYLMVWIGRQKRRATGLDFNKVKEKFVNDVNDEGDRCLKDVFTNDEIRLFLINLACIAPFSIKDDALLGKLAEIIGKKLDTIKDKINALVKAGVLRTVGNSIRFNPDMKGDVYLAYELEKMPHEELNELLKVWLALCAEKLFVNLEGASRYGDVPALDTIFSEIIDTWTREASETSRFERDERLKLAQTIAGLAPKASLNLMYAYLDSEPPPPKDKLLKSLGSGMKLTSDDFSPVIAALLRTPESKKEIFTLIEEIHSRKMEGFYDNYKPLSLAKDAVSPLHNSIGAIFDTLAVFSEWLQSPNANRIALISAALSEILAGSHSYTKSIIRGIEFGERHLRPGKAINDMRDRAMAVLMEMLWHKSLDVKLAGIKVAEDIGNTRGGIGPRQGIPLADRIAQDIAKALEEVGKLISPDADFMLLGKIEDLLIKWWGLEIAGSERAAEYLRAFPRSVEYLAFRYFASSDYAIRDFKAIEEEVTKDDRWSWVVHNIMHDEKRSKPDYYKLEVEKLIEKYDSEEKIVAFLADLGRKISGCEPWPWPQVVTCWVRLEQGEFTSIRSTKELWEAVPERFRSEVDQALSEMEAGFVNKFAEEVLSDLPSAGPAKMHTLFTMLGRQKVEERVLRDWLTGIAEHGNKDQRLLLVRNLDHATNRNPVLMLEMLSKCLSMEKDLDSRMTHDVSFIVHLILEHSEKIDKTLLEPLKDELLRKLMDLPELDWNANELLRFCFTGVDSAISFLEYRLRKSIGRKRRGDKGKSFEAVPFEGLKSVSAQIKSYGDFERLMEKVIDWQKRDDIDRKFYLDHLMEPLLGLSDAVSHKTFLEEFTDRQVEQGNLEKAMIVAEYLPLREGTIEMFMKLSEKAISAGRLKDVQSLLSRKTIPKGAWSTSPGEPSPALAELKSIFQKMAVIAKPGELRVFLGKCAAYVDADIKSQLKLDEEFLNPRG